MKFKEFIDRALFYISVPVCVCCKERMPYTDKPLCEKCLSEYNKVIKRNCSLCAKDLNQCMCSNEYLSSHYVKRLTKVYRYVPDDDLPTNALIYSLKRDNRQDVVNFLTDQLYNSIINTIENPSDCIFTNVPRKKSSVIKYGMDHAERLSRAVAKKFGAIHMKLLESEADKQQKHLGTRERVLNAKFKLIKNAPDLKGKRIIIVDDIVTTGATMGACAFLIRGLGTKMIQGATISIAYKDSQT